MYSINKKFKLFILFLFLISFTFTSEVIAQRNESDIGNNNIPQVYEGFENNTPIPETQGAPSDPCFGQDPQDLICPIDDYVYVLLAIGLGYGFFKFRKQTVGSKV